MSLEEAIKNLSKNSNIEIDRDDKNGDISITLKRINFKEIVRIYPEAKGAEFLDVNPKDEYIELLEAIKNRYWDFPQLIPLVDVMNSEGYDIRW